MDRLPPPAFPPGSRRSAVARPRRSGSEEKGEPAPLPAGYISPDEPFRRIDPTLPDDAFISPDEPFRPRAQPGDEVEAPLDLDEDFEVEVTGIGERDPGYYASLARAEPLGIEEIARILDALARHLREEGPAALLREQGPSNFEAVLRGYLAGYLTRGERG